jgi:hypothetical protein
MPPLGRALGRLNAEDFQTVVDKGLLQYSRLLKMASASAFRLSYSLHTLSLRFAAQPEITALDCFHFYRRRLACFYI